MKVVYTKERVQLVVAFYCKTATRKGVESGDLEDNYKEV